MKTKLTIITVLLVMLFSTTAYAEDGFYAGAGVGIAYHKSRIYNELNVGVSRFTFKEATSLAGYLGYRYGWIKGEVEIDYASHAAEWMLPLGKPLSGNLQRTSFMANLLAFRELGNWELYGGAGAGTSSIRWNNVRAAGVIGSVDSTKSAFTYQLIAGVSYAFSEMTALGIRYKYMDGNDYQPVDSTGTAGKFRFPASHLVTANVELRFN